jgi:hypothetical protein
MRKYLLAVLFFAMPVLADESTQSGTSGPLRVKIEVGEKKAVCPDCLSPICDNPGVAVLSAEGAGVVTGVGPGKTLCSAKPAAGPRRLFEIEVSVPLGGDK